MQNPSGGNTSNDCNSYDVTTSAWPCHCLCTPNPIWAVPQPLLLFSCSAAAAMLRTSSLGTIRPDPSLWVDPPGLRRWLVAVAAFRFDLEQGQLLEACYPAGALSAEEELDIGFSCFPDSMATAHSRSSVHDCFFFFRLRRRGTPPQAASTEAPRRASTGELERHVSSKFTDAQPRSPVAIPSPRRGGSTEKGAWGSPSNRRHLQRGMSDLGTSSPAAGALGGSGDPGMSPREAFLQSTPSLDSHRAAAASPGLRRTSFSGPLTPPPRQPSDPSSPLFMASPIEEQPTPGQHRRTPTSDFPRSPSLAASGATPGKTGGGASGGRVRYLYGFVFNRQRQDERLRRGGEQKSVVLLSERPFTGVFRPMVQIAGPLYFDTGAKALEQVCNNPSKREPHIRVLEASEEGSLELTNECLTIDSAFQLQLKKELLVVPTYIAAARILL